MLILGMTMICLKFLQSPHAPLTALPWMKGGSVNPPGDVQKTGMEDAALRPRFRTAQQRGAELSQSPHAPLTALPWMKGGSVNPPGGCAENGYGRCRVAAPFSHSSAAGAELS